MAAKIPVAGLLMPKATAVWLVENTPLTFEQIAAFTGLHHIEVQAMADEEVGRGIVGRNPVEHNEVTKEELDKAINDALNGDGTYCMKMAKSDLPSVKVRAKGPRYTPVTKRQDKPDAIAYILKHNPEISDAQICKLIGTTKPTIQSIRDREHPNMPNIKARHPVDCGLCTYGDLDAASRKGLKAQGKTPEEIAAHKEKAYQQESAGLQETEKSSPSSGFDFSNFLKSSSN
ncbi:MAG: cell cycle transcriptional regulator TrcR [Micavibrio sp.]